MPFFRSARQKGRKEISEPENHRFRGLKKENQNPRTTAAAGPTCFENLKEPAVFIKEPANELAVLWLRLFDLSNLLRTVVIDQNWVFF